MTVTFIRGENKKCNPLCQGVFVVTCCVQFLLFSALDRAGLLQSGGDTQFRQKPSLNYEPSPQDKQPYQPVAHVDLLDDRCLSFGVSGFPIGMFHRFLYLRTALLYCKYVLSPADYHAIDSLQWCHSYTPPCRESLIWINEK